MSWDPHSSKQVRRSARLQIQELQKICQELRKISDARLHSWASNKTERVSEIQNGHQERLMIFSAAAKAAVESNDTDTFDEINIGTVLECIRVMPVMMRHRTWLLECLKFAQSILGDPTQPARLQKLAAPFGDLVMRIIRFL